jgi:hypothetical protein
MIQLHVHETGGRRHIGYPLGTLLITSMYVVPYLLNSQAPWSSVLLLKLIDAVSRLLYGIRGRIATFTRGRHLYLYPDPHEVSPYPHALCL